jgi:transcriptional regulator with PAS, ATPase and Fis domain
VTLLSSIAADVREVATAISLALGCDVEVIDSDLCRVAATGSIKVTEGQTLQHGHVYSFLMQHKQNLVIDAPGFHFLCQQCNLRGKCYYEYGIAVPIVLEGKAIGLIAIAAFDSAAKDRISRDLTRLLPFLAKMADMLVSKAREAELVASLQTATAELMTILNTSNEGIIALNAANEVLHYNKAALNLFGARNPSGLKLALASAFDLNGSFASSGETRRQVLINNRRILVNLKNIELPTADKNKALLLAMCRDYNAIKKYAGSMVLPANEVVFDHILTQDASFQALLDMARKVAPTDSTVLITGESGTGKELVARAIHSASGRKGPFVPINCGAIPESLLESELFGYEEGAFTGARREGKPGKFELADGGTLFLDEVATMPLHLQAKLLRVLEDRKVERLGGITPIAVDVRVLAATNEQLDHAVRAGSFREDLYFRLNVIPLPIPPLRERRGDIVLLANHFLRLYGTRFSKRIERIEDAALALLEAYDWPGNIRELSNVIEFAVNMEEAEVLRAQTVRLHRAFTKEDIRDMAALKAEALTRHLQEFGWTKKGKLRAAKAMGVSIATVYRWIKKYHLQPGG